MKILHDTGLKPLAGKHCPVKLFFKGKDMIFGYQLVVGDVYLYKLFFLFYNHTIHRDIFKKAL